MNTQKMVIQRIPYGRMLKSEVAELGNKTVAIAQSHNAELLLIEPLVDELEALMPEINTMSFRYGVDPEILKVKTLKSKLMLTISSLKLEVKLLEKSGIDEDLHLINSFINGNLLNLHAAKNEKVLSQRINGFLHAIEAEEALAQAVEAKSLMKNVDSIKIAFRDYKIALAKRVRLLAVRPKFDTSLIVSKILEALENLYKTIDVFHMTNPDFDYTGLIDELNQQARMYSRSISIRLANNRRKLEAKKNEAETDAGSNGSDGSIEEEAPQATSHRGSSSSGSSQTYFLASSEEDSSAMNQPSAPASTNGSGSEKNNAESLDQKKTVAETGILSQQPSVSSSNDNA